MAATGVALLIAGCGGGGGGAGEPTAPAVSSLQLSGTAAVGAALADAQVSVKCATGSGTGTTNASGGYSVTMEGAALPCMIQVSGETGGVSITLHSVAEAGTSSGNTTSAVANVTPVTEMIVAQLLAALPADGFAGFDPQQVTPEALAKAAGAIVDALKSAGIDLGSIDPLKTTLVPASGGQQGNAYDQLLDKLGETVPPESLPQVVNQIAGASATGSEAGLDNAMQAVASGALEGCPAALSGQYRVIDYNGALQNIAVDFKAMTVAVEGASGTLPITRNSSQACEFSLADATVVMGPGGVGALTQPGMTAYVIPRQSHPLASIVGTWNFMESGLDESNTGTHAIGQFTVNADGTGSACDYDVAAGDFSVCHVDDEKPSVSANADGGFDLQYGTDASRIFAFRAANGELTLFGTNNPGNSWDPTAYRTHVVLTKPRKLQLPAVDSQTKSWELRVNFASGSLTAVPLVADGFKVTATDATAGTLTRERASNAEVDTLKVNYPVDGLRFREAKPGLASVYQMALPSLGFWVIADNHPALHFHVLAVSRP